MPAVLLLVISILIRFISERTTNDVSGVLTVMLKGSPTSPDKVIINGDFSILSCSIRLSTLVIMSDFC